MKSTIITFALCALCAGAKAQTVTVPDVEALPGETVAFTLNLTDGKADTYTAMQFDVQFPAAGFTTTGKYSVSELWANATAIVGTVDGDGMATIPIASSETISAADVEGLLSVNFTVGSEVALGEYDVMLKNLWFGYGTSSKDYLEDVTFKVKVVSAHSVLLDEASTEAPVAADGVNVRVKRTIKANEWSTICLPFAMDATQVKAAFGDDVELGDFSSWSSEENDGGDIVAITVGFTSVTAIEANHPYIIRVSSAISEFTADNVSIDAEEEPTKQVGTKKAERGYFIGTYTANTAVPNETLFLNGNQFWYSTGSTKMKAFRGWFEFADVLTEVENASAPVFISFNSDVTAIRNIEQSEGDGRYYNLNGQHVTNVKKGLYIKNGKKVVVK